MQEAQHVGLSMGGGNGHYNKLWFSMEKSSRILKIPSHHLLCLMPLKNDSKGGAKWCKILPTPDSKA